MVDEENIDQTETPKSELGASADVLKEAWQSTLTEMDALAERYESDGWETAAVPAGHTAPASEEAGKNDRWGIVFTVPGNYAEAIEKTVTSREYPEYDVYRSQVADRIFLIVIYIDPSSDHALLVAGNYQINFSQTLQKHAMAAGELYSYLRELDDTRLAVFKHNAPEKFFPDI
jgi:hypothetical protein